MAGFGCAAFGVWVGALRRQVLVSSTGGDYEACCAEAGSCQDPILHFAKRLDLLIGKFVAEVGRL